MIDVYSDPLHEVRVPKRWALAGVGLSVATLLPTYALLLGLGLAEVVFVVMPAAVAGFSGIELGSRWEYRMRRRYAYPHRLGYEMASIHDFLRAGEHGSRLVRARRCRWLAERGRPPAYARGFPRRDRALLS